MLFTNGSKSPHSKLYYRAKQKQKNRHTFMEAKTRAPPLFRITFNMKKRELVVTDIVIDYMKIYMNNIQIIYRANNAHDP